jgi:mono/diheme cytochrome c family protein
MNTQRLLRQVAGLVVIGLLGLAAGLALGEEGAPEGKPFIGDVPNGSRLYRMNCAVCHGFDGEGKGPAASTLKTAPADLTDGSLMNALDNALLFRVLELGCKGIGCKGAMPGFLQSMTPLENWDVVAYLRTLHLPLVAFLPQVDEYLVKRYTIGEIGNADFKQGQLDRLKKALKQIDAADRAQTVFTLYKTDHKNPNPVLIPQEPRRLAQLKKENKVGYVLFMTMAGPRGQKFPVGVGLDPDYKIVRLVTTLRDPTQASEYNNQLMRFEGAGKRGDKFELTASKDKVGQHFDAAVARLYALAIEAATSYEYEERERSWADGTF